MCPFSHCISEAIAQGLHVAVLGVYKDGKLQLVLGDQTPVRHHDERIASGAMTRE